MAKHSNIPHTLELSTKICHRLPRELRNRIYSFLDLDHETKQSKPIEQFVGDQFCEQFSCECIHWYYENVQQTLCRPFIVSTIEYLKRDCPSVKRVPGLTIILEGSCSDDDFERLAMAMDEFKATGYFDDLNKDFKVRICIDLKLHPLWRTENPNVERAVTVARSVLQYFKPRTESALCFGRVPDVEEFTDREEGLDITQQVEESTDDSLNILGMMVHFGIESAWPRIKFDEFAATFHST